MKEFKYDHFVTIGETNMEGNVYWTEFLTWFGKAREIFLVNLLPEVNIPEFLLGRELVIVTCETTSKNLRSAFFTDQIEIKVKPKKVEHCSVVLAFEMKNKKTEEVLCVGEQKIAFVNINTGKPARIPKELKVAVSEYL